MFYCLFFLHAESDLRGHASSGGLVDDYTIQSALWLLSFFFFKQKTAYEIASCLVGSDGE